MSNIELAQGVWWNTLLDCQLDDSLEIRERIDEIVEQHRPDWFCLQEVVQQPGGVNPVRTKLESLGYETSYERIFDHQTAQIGWMIASKLPIVESELISFLPPVPNSDKEEWPYMQTATLKFGQKNLVVGNSHFVHTRPETLINQRAQRQALEQRQNDARVAVDVFGGDLNSLRIARTISRLQRTHDIRTGTFINPTWVNKDWPHFGLNLDYVGVRRSSGFAVIDFQLLEAWPSDHKPLMIALGSVSS